MNWSAFFSVLLLYAGVVLWAVVLFGGASFLSSKFPRHDYLPATAWIITYVAVTIAAIVGLAT